MRQHNFKVGQNNEPVIKIRARKRAVNPSYDLTGKTFAFYVKDSSETLDDDAFAVYRLDAGITVPDPSTGEILVQITQAATADSGSFFYHFDMIDGTRSVTRLYGEWQVRDV